MRLRLANKGRRHSESGVTLLELIIATSILLVLATAALPVVRFKVQRTKEAQLHRALREIRDAIDHYKDYADRNLIRVEVGSEGYPPDLDTLVKAIQIGAGSDRKIRFLRRIPVDPMTGRAEWNLQAVQDDPDVLEAAATYYNKVIPREPYVPEAGVRASRVDAAAQDPAVGL